MRDGGADRDRTDDILLAKQALSQLSYGPEPEDALAGLPSRSSRAEYARLRLTATAWQPSLAARAKAGGPGKI